MYLSQRSRDPACAADQPIPLNAPPMNLLSARPSHKEDPARSSSGAEKLHKSPQRLAISLRLGATRHDDPFDPAGGDTPPTRIGPGAERAPARAERGGVVHERGAHRLSGLPQHREA